MSTCGEHNNMVIKHFLLSHFGSKMAFCATIQSLQKEFCESAFVAQSFLCYCLSVCIAGVIKNKSPPLQKSVNGRSVDIWFILL